MKTIKCDYFKKGKCLKGIEPTAECNNCPCGKPADTCVLLCNCEEETCNIGTLFEEELHFREGVTAQDAIDWGGRFER